MSGNGADLGAIYGAIVALDRKMERRFADQAVQVAGLRADVASYHASVVGHGVLISELGERVSRIEQRLAALEPEDLG